MDKNQLTRTFETLWRQIDGPPLEKEVRFCPTRKWRFDFADSSAMVAVEVDGGTWSGGRHTSGVGFDGDCEKINAATLAGWRVFRFTGSMLRNDPAGHLIPVRDLILSRRKGND